MTLISNHTHKCGMRYTVNLVRIYTDLSMFMFQYESILIYLWCVYVSVRIHTDLSMVCLCLCFSTNPYRSIYLCCIYVYISVRLPSRRRHCRSSVGSDGSACIPTKGSSTQFKLSSFHGSITTLAWLPVGGRKGVERGWEGMGEEGM